MRTSHWGMGEEVVNAVEHDFLPCTHKEFVQRKFVQSKQGSQQVQMSTIPGATTAWEVPCDTRVTFTVHIGSQQFSVDESLLVVDQGNGKCISLVEGFIDDSVTQYIFGQNWLSALYV